MPLTVRKILGLAESLRSKVRTWDDEKPLKLEVPRPETKNLPPNESCLGSTLHIKGEISGSEALFVDGTVEGLIHLENQRVILSPLSKVDADIVASDVIMRGKLRGNVRASYSIAISKEGSVVGNLTTPEILIEDGAFFKGSIEIENWAERETHRAASSPAEPIRKNAAHA